MMIKVLMLDQLISMSDQALAGHNKLNYSLVMVHLMIILVYQ